MTPLDYLAKEYVELTMVKQRYDSDDVYFFRYNLVEPFLGDRFGKETL